jgi:alpha-L-rhamnosidase
MRKNIPRLPTKSAPPSSKTSLRTTARFSNPPRRVTPSHSRWIAGRADVAYKLLLQESFPSWLFQVKLGATTMWERWDGWTPEKGFQDPGMNSFNHYAFGSVGEWLFATVAGIETDSPGFQKFSIRPTPGGNLTFAKARYDSMHGPIVSEWQIRAGSLRLNIGVPPNTTALIHVPCVDPQTVTESGLPAASGAGVQYLHQQGGYAVYRVGSGEYQFACPA